MYGKIFSEMGMMAFTMAAGYLLRRRELITEAGKKSLTNLILYFILPCNIIKAFCIPFSRQLLVQMSMALLAAVLVQVISMLLAAAVYRRLPKGERQVFQYGTVCSNAGFIGNAVAQGVYGDTGLLIASIYLIPLRIVMWTAGISYFTEGGSVWKSMKKVLLHPCMIAVYIGMALFLTQAPLPEVISLSLSTVSASCTGLIMVYIGTILCGVHLRELVSLDQIYFAVIRLAVIPALMWVMCRMIRADSIITGVCTLLAAMPAGSTTSILAAQYGADEKAAAKCVVFTTALSAVAIPLWCVILQG